MVKTAQEKNSAYPALDWLVEAYEDKRYEFYIETEGPKKIDALVYEDGVLIEKYFFRNFHTPRARITYNYKPDDNEEGDV